MSHETNDSFQKISKMNAAHTELTEIRKEILQGQRGEYKTETSMQKQARQDRVEGKLEHEWLSEERAEVWVERRDEEA